MKKFTFQKSVTKDVLEIAVSKIIGSPVILHDVERAGNKFELTCSKKTKIHKKRI